MTWSVLIADDEPLARKKLRSLLAEVEWATRVIEATDGPSTLRAIEEDQPDLAILDIRMPGMTGIEVMKQAKCRPRVIFATAYDRFAVTAFELQAVDYLLKPFGRERFGEALERARRSEADFGVSDRAHTALEEEYLDRLFVRERGKIIPVSVDEIVRVEAEEDYALVVSGDRQHLVHVTMNQLETRLNPSRFLRIHRSHIVNLDFVEAMVPCDGSRLEVRMKDGSTVMASRRRSKDIRGLAV